MQRLLIQSDDPASPEVGELIEQLDRYQAGLYPAASNHLVPAELLRRPDVVFLTARLGGRVVGCGAFVNRGEYAEIKRMFVVPESRGKKVGRRLLDELERRARAAGLRLARLETGVAQPEALRLYERAGYRRRGPFGDYPEDPCSMFLEKALAGE